jgi:hypothetical protein
VAHESLEDRRLFSVALSSAGWTVVTPSSTAHRIYVSSAHGNDKNSGLTAAAPVATLAAGYALLRTGTDDQLLLERGDTWTTSFPQWTKSGASASNPMVVGTYGTGNRPLIYTGTGDGIAANSPRGSSYLVIQGLNFIANGRDPSLAKVSAAAAAAQPDGLQILGAATDITVEDCAFSYYGNGIDVQGMFGTVSNVTVRRTTVQDAYCTSQHSQGLYADTMSGLTLDQDVFDHNGWNATVAGAGMTVFNHDVYVYATATGLTLTDCVISNASYAGIMARSGGVIQDNLFLNDAVGVAFGATNGADSPAGGTKGNVENNVFMGDHAVGGVAYGEGVEVDDTARGAGVTVSGNVFAGDTEQAQAAINLAFPYATLNPSATVGLNGVTVSDNVVYGWDMGINMSSFVDGGTGMTGLSGLVVTGNQIAARTFDVLHASTAYSTSAEAWSRNTYTSAWPTTQWYFMGANVAATTWKSKVESTAAFGTPTYAAPTRTAATYAGTLGKSATNDAFVAAAAAQSDLSWSTSLTAASAVAYIKAGFVAKAAVASAPVYTQLTGTTIGTAGSYQNAGNTIAKATDGNLSTFFDGPVANGDWVGLDLGSAKTISQIKFAPRSGWASRMLGGVFQVSNSPTFSTGVTTVYTVTSSPVTGSLTTVTLSSAVTGRYVRYLAPNGSYGDVAEVQFFG